MGKITHSEGKFNPFDLCYWNIDVTGSINVIKTGFHGFHLVITYKHARCPPQKKKSVSVVQVGFIFDIK